jgi:hypothetical protein
MQGCKDPPDRISISSIKTMSSFKDVLKVGVEPHIDRSREAARGPATSLLPTAVRDQAAATAAIAAKVASFAHRVVSSTISHFVRRLDIR